MLMDILKYNVEDNSLTTSTFEAVKVKQLHHRNAVYPLMLFSVVTMLGTVSLNQNIMTTTSQEVVFNETFIEAPIVKSGNKMKIFQQFVSDLIVESIDLEPELMKIANDNFKKLLW
jgi:hypothetical protein